MKVDLLKIALLGLIAALGMGGMVALAGMPQQQACLETTIVPEHVKRTIDGDTFILYHVGVPPEERIRVLGVDTPERGQPGADSATAFTRAWVKASDFIIRACRRDSFGRLLATVKRGTSNLADTLIALHLGVPR